MSNALYPSGRLGVADQSIDVIGDTVKVVALSSAYTYNLAHSMRDDLTGELGTATTLTGKVWLSDAVFDADDVSYPDVPALSIVRRLAIFMDSGSPASSPLIAYIDETNQGTAIEQTSTGGPIPILWDNGFHRIFRL